MACSSCSRRSVKKRTVGVVAPDTVSDFTKIGPTQTRIRSGNGQHYSILSPLVKMRPPVGWNLWVSVKGHKHYIEGANAKLVVDKIIALYKTNDIDIPPATAWLNANKVWVSKMAPRHSYATVADLNAISKSTTDPLIWDKRVWEHIFVYVKGDDYSESMMRDLVKYLFDIAADKITGCENCYDELTHNAPEDYSDQEKMKKWLDERFANIVDANA